MMVWDKIVWDCMGWYGMGWFGEIRLNGVAWLLYTFCIDEYGEVWDGVV